jgi:NAD(P)-dependent dehydrogenase (short-subunit alcohol dehydrogenase family)
VSAAATHGAVLVTGASTGIGEATAALLAARGVPVIAGARGRADLERLGAIAGVEPLELDVTDPSAIDALRTRLAGTALRGLVNNAGISVVGPLEESPLDEIRRQFEVNTIGQIAVTQAALPSLRAARGRIVNIGSIGGRVGQPFVGAYCGSKGALHLMSSSLRRELRPWGIWVTCIEPGTIATQIWGKGERAAQEALEAMSPEGRARYGPAMDAMSAVVRRQGRSGLQPEAVARRVEHALFARRPPAYELVGRDARTLSVLQTLLPARIWDRVMVRALGV